MAQKIIPRVLALVLLLGVLAGCTTEPLNMGPNGDSRLREIKFLNRTLYPEFDPTHHDYLIYEDGEPSVVGFVKPFIFLSKFTLNGQRVRMQTNIYKLPDMTDLTPYFVTAEGETGVLGKDRVCNIEVVAQDGNSREYTITLKGPASDARILDIRGKDPTKKVILRSEYQEFGGPYYTIDGKEGASEIEISVGEMSANILLVKAQASAKVFLDNVPVSGDTENPTEVTLNLTDIASTWTPFEVKVISSDNSTTNRKTINAIYYNPTKDARITSMKVFANGAEVPFLPRFDYNGAITYRTNRQGNNTGNAKYFTDIEEAMVVVLDDVIDNTATVRIEGTVMYPTGTTFEFRRGKYVPVATANDVALNYASSLDGPEKTDTSIAQPAIASDGSFVLNNISVEQGDRLRIRAKRGGGYIDYLFEFRLFSKKIYGFDGGIQALQKTIYQLTDTTGKGMEFNISGIVTMLNIYPDNVAREGWFIEDGAYGLYNWSYNAYPNASRPGQVQVGHKIKMNVLAAKIWIGMPEVTSSSSTETEVLEDRKRYAIHYLNGNLTEFSGQRHLGRILRYSTYDEGSPLAGDYDANGMGALNMSKNFKFFFPYTKGLKDLMPTMNYTQMRTSADANFQGTSFWYNGKFPDPSAANGKPIVISHVVDYMKAGTHGVFYGPMFVDSEGTSMIVKDNYYMSVPVVP